MALRIMWHLAIYVFVSVISLVSGSWPGMISVHPSGHASYVGRSHCVVSDSVSHAEFLELTTWCASLHEKK